MTLDKTNDLRDAFLDETLLPAFENFETLLTDMAATRVSDGCELTTLSDGVRLGSAQCTFRLDSTKTPPLLRLSFVRPGCTAAEPEQMNLKTEVSGKGILNMKLHWVCTQSGQKWLTEELIIVCLDKLTRQPSPAELKTSAVPEPVPVPTEALVPLAAAAAASVSVATHEQANTRASSPRKETESRAGVSYSKLWNSNQ